MDGSLIPADYDNDGIIALNTYRSRVEIVEQNTSGIPTIILLALVCHGKVSIVHLYSFNKTTSLLITI